MKVIVVFILMTTLLMVDILLHLPFLIVGFVWEIIYQGFESGRIRRDELSDWMDRFEIK